MAANQQALAVYAARTSPSPQAPLAAAPGHRPGPGRLGEEDGIATADYGRLYAASFPNGHYTPIKTPATSPHRAAAAVLAAISDFVANVIKPDGD